MLPWGSRAADVYARIAPEAPHALHMPTHIYVQLGMWDRVLASNEAAYAASVKWVESKGLSLTKRDFHSLEWGQYGALQLGQYDKARDMFPLAEQVAAQTEDPRAQGSRPRCARATWWSPVAGRTCPCPSSPRPRRPGPGPPRSTAPATTSSWRRACPRPIWASRPRRRRRFGVWRPWRRSGRTRGSAYDAQPLEIMAAQVEGLSEVPEGRRPREVSSGSLAAAQLEETHRPAERTHLSDQALARALRRRRCSRPGRGREAQKAFETALRSECPAAACRCWAWPARRSPTGTTETAAEAYGQLTTFWAAADPGRERDEVRGYRPARHAAVVKP